MTEEVAAEFWQGVEQFNQHQFYACHDTLEALWMEAAEPQRTFYQGVLQIAVALYHLESANIRGAMILLGEGANRLRPYQPSYASIDVTELLTRSAALLTRLQQANPEQAQQIIEQMQQLCRDHATPSDLVELPTLSKIAP
jgi:predicted metal-dependent hydrolase